MSNILKKSTSVLIISLSLLSICACTSEKPPADTVTVSNNVSNNASVPVSKQTEDEPVLDLDALLPDRSHETQSSDLSLDTSLYDYYNRKSDEDAVKYYPAYSDTFDDYGKYTYNGLDRVGLTPQGLKELQARASEIDKNNEKYLYKGRKEDLFTIPGGTNITIHDSVVYPYIFGYCRPSKEVLLRTLEKNDKLPEKYKAVFKEQICDWMDNNPGIDLTLLNENLYTLDLMECNSDQLAMYAVSAEALACYRWEENTIYVKKDSEMNNRFKGILKHELTHASRTYIFKNGDSFHLSVRYDTYDYDSLFADESMATLFTSYENAAGLYPLVVNCYRIITEACHYTCSDYMNHSVYELRDKINYYLGDIADADEIIKGIDAIGQFIYVPSERAKNNITVDKVKDILKLVIRICLKNNPDVSKEDVFNMLDRDISSHKKYDEFLTSEVISALYDEVA